MPTQNIINQIGPTPQLFVSLSGNQTISNSGTSTLVTLDTVAYDTTSAFNVSTHLYTPLVSGNYLTIISAIVTETSGTYSIQGFISKNSGDTLEWINDDAFIAGFTTISISSIVQMNGSTDTLSFRMKQTSSGNITLNGGNSVTYMSVSLLR